MREFMLMVLSAQLFVMCISGAMWFFGTELGVSAISDRSLGVDLPEAEFNATAQSYATNPFNIVFVFGDFTAALTQFFNVVSGGYVFTMMSLFGFAQSFITGMQVIFSLGVVLSASYILSGRG